MDEILKSIDDEGKRKKAEDLAREKGWPIGLAAVAVLSNRADATSIINNALKNAAVISAQEADKAKTQDIARLQEGIAKARENKDFKTMIAMKSQLYERYGIGSL